MSGAVMSSRCITYSPNNLATGLSRRNATILHESGLHRDESVGFDSAPSLCLAAMRPCAKPYPQDFFRFMSTFWFSAMMI